MNIPAQNARGSVSVSAPAGVSRAALAGKRSLQTAGGRASVKALAVGAIAKAVVNLAKVQKGKNVTMQQAEELFQKFMRDPNLSLKDRFHSSDVQAAAYILKNYL